MPVTLIVLLAVERDLALASLGVMAALLLVGVLEQSVRLRSLPQWVAWAGRVGALAIGLAMLQYRHDWMDSRLPFADSMVIMLAGATGLLAGLFLASLGHRTDTQRHASLGTDQGRAHRGVLEVLADANQLAMVPQEGSAPLLEPVERSVEPVAMEIEIAGRWVPGVLHGWTTRDLSLFGNVTFELEGVMVDRWVPGAQLRRSATGE